ncbi:putative U3 small nucleolar RNA-associated protein 11 [Hypsizygus marmoreus]|uniref:U3 small nucleolar RNA-associated protein 11 n=1 Tax=Hypsizygus marmoreus TaxID=39966 RepID=A0A369K7D3_HYPMA|nr:putative U3 small nucleolar RNA-associated protein 11 [Hypsizygus marmoreus]
MTSSLRNSIHRRNHKERSQLAHRSKLGILEKHADYVKRARDYHSKQDRLTRLKQKAAEKNKDEFYFSMQNVKTKGGVHVQDRGNTALPTDIVKVLKTQDENYVRTMRAAGLKKIDKLKSQLTALADLLKPGSLEREGADDGLDDEELEILTEAGIISGQTKSSRRKPKHIIFVDNEEEARNYKPLKDPSSSRQDDVDMDAEAEVDLGWKSTESKKKKKHVPHADGSHDDDMALSDPSKAGDNRRRLLKELSARLARDKQLRYTEREFEMQRLMMGKGGRKKLKGAEKVQGDSDEEEDEDEIDARKGKRRSLVQKVDEKTYKPRVYKWRLERKR